MPAREQWDEESSDSSSAPPSPPVGAVRRNKFDDEEGEDSDVLDSWDAAEDSEVEREKEKKAAEAKAAAEAEAKANKKSKAQRIKEHQEKRAAELAAGGDFSDNEETEAEKRERLRRTEKDSDLKHAEDLFGGVGGVPASRKHTTVGTAVAIDSSDPNRTVNIAELPLFNPTTKTQFEALRTTMVPIIGAHQKKPHYTLFLQEFSKQLAKDLPSDQIKKIASTLTALGNEKMREEKASQAGNKKSKASKTKATLVANRPDTHDTQAYDEEAFGDDDFM